MEDGAAVRVLQAPAELLAAVSWGQDVAELEYATAATVARAGEEVTW